MLYYNCSKKYIGGIEMNKLLKLVVMAIIMLAIVAISINVNAYTNNDLIAHLSDTYTIGDTTYRLKPEKQKVLKEYFEKNADIDADSIVKDLQAIDSKIKESKATSLDDIDATVGDEIIKLAQKAAKTAGLTVNIDSENGILSIVTEDGTALIEETFDVGNEEADVTDSTETEKSENNVTDSNEAEEKSDAKTDEKSSKAKKLLYTGADSFVYVLPLLAIVAVAIVAKKRA